MSPTVDSLDLEVIDEFDVSDFDEDFDDDFEEEIKGEYDLQDDQYGEVFGRSMIRPGLANESESELKGVGDGATCTGPLALVRLLRRLRVPLERVLPFQPPI